MACSSLNLLSSEQQQQNGFAGPRISFSNGFADAQQHQGERHWGAETAPAADFEFIVANGTLNSAADELFFDGKLLPLRRDNNKNMIFSPAFNNMKITTTTTLRDELLMDDSDITEDDLELDMTMRLPRAPKGTSWKGRFRSFKIKSSHL